MINHFSQAQSFAIFHLNEQLLLSFGQFWNKFLLHLTNIFAHWSFSKFFNVCWSERVIPLIWYWIEFIIIGIKRIFMTLRRKRIEFKIILFIFILLQLTFPSFENFEFSNSIWTLLSFFLLNFRHNFVLFHFDLKRTLVTFTFSSFFIWVFSARHCFWIYVLNPSLIVPHDVRMMQSWQ